MQKRTVTKDDGRTLILYHFTTEAGDAPQAPAASHEGEKTP
jgi:hypothetical protein